MQSSWRSPSNIALIKYWGKYPGQLPANASLSYTLSASHTDTTVRNEGKTGTRDFRIRLFLDGQARPDFEPKIQQFLARLGPEADFLRGLDLRIDTHNSFPHSSGIASSASGLSALALCLLDLRQQASGKEEEDFFRTASHWARLGSGSASRSVYGPLVLWGRHSAFAESNDTYAIPYPDELHPSFNQVGDCILLVEQGQKSVSSSAGHRLMEGHAFAEARFQQAGQNLSALKEILRAGDWEAFGIMLESEALTLHAMMMSSKPYYLLMKPDTLRWIEALWAWRREKALPLYFTLDAGANIHLLYPPDIEQEVLNWVITHKEGFGLGAYIRDQSGKGPIRLEI